MFGYLQVQKSELLVREYDAYKSVYCGLCKQLGKFGYEARALTYKKNYDFLELGIENKYSISFRSIPYYIGYLFQKGFGRTLYNYNKRKILNRFRQGLFSCRKRLRIFRLL